MKPFTIHPDAEAELREALAWYERKQPGLGGRFRSAFEAGLERVRDNPLQYADEDGTGVRMCPLDRFPYVVVYVDLGEHIWVAAVAHTKRREGYWSGRRPEDETG